MRQKGFTLLEISIVLVIIGLIVGAISVGSKFIRNAQLNAIGSEYQKNVTAIKNFQDKYLSLPGDFPTATSNWTAAGACPIATTTGTCNGGGDGQITNYEQFYAWQHLALAGMIEGLYSGYDVASGGSYDRVPGTNIPTSQLGGAGWGLIYTATTSTDISYQTGDIAPLHVLWLGGKSVTGNNSQQEPLLTAEEADLLDRKFDDGMPYVGKIVSQVNSSGTACQSSASAYNVTATGKNCALVFKTGF